MVTLTPSARGRDSQSQGSSSLFYFILLGLFGAFSFVQMVRSKHLHDHGDTKPSLRRDGVTTTDGDIRKKGAVHDRYVVSMEHSKSENSLEGNVELPRRSTAKTIRSYFTTGKKEDVEQQQQKQQQPQQQIPKQQEHTGAMIGTKDEVVRGNLQTPKLHAVTYASHGGRDDRFCRALESAIRHDYDLVILGWGVKWEGLSQKLEAAQNYAASIDANDIMLFTDAFDVLYLERPIVVQNEFQKMNADIVFSGECGCWPHVMENRGKICLDGYPKAPTPYRYLNSGTWIGKASKASAMLKEVIKEAGSDFANANDQKLVADFYIAGRFGIQLDFYNKIFQSMHMTLDPPLPRCDPTKDVELTGDGRFYNSLTKSRPAIFHFNGGGKKVHLKMEGQVWYKREENNAPAKIRELRSFLVATPTEKDPQRRTRFDLLCPGYLTTIKRPR